MERPMPTLESEPDLLSLLAAEHAADDSQRAHAARIARRRANTPEERAFLLREIQRSQAHDAQQREQDRQRRLAEHRERFKLDSRRLAEGCATEADLECVVRYLKLELVGGVPLRTCIPHDTRLTAAHVLVFWLVVACVRMGFKGLHASNRAIGEALAAGGYGHGLARSTVREAVNRLRQRKLLTRRPTYDPDAPLDSHGVRHSRRANRYELGTLGRMYLREGQVRAAARDAELERAQSEIDRLRGELSLYARRNSCSHPAENDRKSTAPGPEERSRAGIGSTNPPDCSPAHQSGPPPTDISPGPWADYCPAVIAALFATGADHPEG
jgi:hypothetical protein